MLAPDLMPMDARGCEGMRNSATQRALSKTLAANFTFAPVLRTRSAGVPASSLELTGITHI